MSKLSVSSVDQAKRRELLRVGQWSLSLLTASLAGPGTTPHAHASQVKAAPASPLGPVLIMRHAQTEPGAGDPAGFQLGQCSTQRNLSAEGRAQAQTFGEQLAKLGLLPAAIRSSRWCRCEQTASLIIKGLGATQALKVQPWPALDSVFVERERAAPQNALLQQRLIALTQQAATEPRHFELWVTHGANVIAFAGTSPSPSQAHWLGVGKPDKAGTALDVKPFAGP
jgi:hypothetical protein